MAESNVAQELSSEILNTIKKSQAAVVDAIETWASAVQSIKPDLPAVNVPFADKPKLDHKGQRYSLHDYFFAKSLDALKPGGVLALVTSHFTLDKLCGRPHN